MKLAKQVIGEVGEEGSSSIVFPRITTYSSYLFLHEKVIFQIEYTIILIQTINSLFTIINNSKESRFFQKKNLITKMRLHYIAAIQIIHGIKTFRDN